MTAIIATVGPALSADRDLVASYQAGCRGYRYPASKESVEEIIVRARASRALLEQYGQVEIFLDLPGAKLRLTNTDGFDLDGITELSIYQDERPASRSATTGQIGVRGGALAASVGDTLVFGDGEDAVSVTSISKDRVVTRPLTRGVLGKRRGVSVLGGAVEHESLTSSDLAGLAQLEPGIFDAVIVSFTEGPEDVERARAQMSEEVRRSTRLIAKIETRRGVDALGDILPGVDGVLLGRGDLLLDVGELDFFDACRAVMKACAQHDVPCMLGTQFLTSLSECWLPNRSELAYLSHVLEKDVAGIMLSFETTVGKSARRTVDLLAELVRRYAPSSATSFFPGGGASEPVVLD